MAAPTDTLYDRQWYLQAIDVPVVWDQYTGRGINVGIVDFDGAEYSHYDLNANANAALNLVYNGRTIDPTRGMVRNHGTSLAGVISGERNGTGIVGVAYDSKFTDIPLVFGGDARDPAYFRAALSHMAAFDVTNLSWNLDPYRTAPGDALYTAIQDGIRRSVETGRGGLGTVVVATSGNDRKGDQWEHGPGDANAAGPHTNDRHTVVVAGVGSDGHVADYSNPGASVLLTAPAQAHYNNADLPGIWTTDRVGTAGFNDATSADGGDFVETRGTSFAAPQVAGVVALMLEANPNLGWRDVREILALSAAHTGSAIPTTAGSPGTLTGAEQYPWVINGATNWNGGGMHFSNDYGFGMLDARAAVRLAESWQQRQTSSNEQSETATFAPPRQVIITDNDSRGVSTTFQLGNAVDIETVTLTLQLSHSNAHDVTVLLTSPSGTTSTLMRNNADDVDIANGWVFTSNAFAGETSGGVWTMRVIDTAAGSQGSYGSASLRAVGTDSSIDDTYFYTDEFGASGRIANETARGRLNDASGHDTINLAAVSTGVRIDLSGITLSSVRGRQLDIADETIEDAIGGDGGDFLLGSMADNDLSGMGGDDLLLAYDGHDTLRGGRGFDRLEGEAGDDTYVLDDQVLEPGTPRYVFDFVVEQEFGGTDTVLVKGQNYPASTPSRASYTLTAYVENGTVTGTGGFVLFGNALANRLTGNGGKNDMEGRDGADVLDGRAGYDVLRGGAGDDTYVLDTLARASSTSALVFDLVEEEAGGGTDTVTVRAQGVSGSSARFGYTLTDDVENAILTATRAFDLTGNRLANELTGNDGANELDGAGGADTLKGGKGDDTYVVDTARDIVVERAGEGTDSVTASFSYTLTSNVENLTLAGKTGLSGTGNASVNRIYGNDGANDLDGRGGGDILYGGKGSDSYTVDNVRDQAIEYVNGGTDTVTASVSFGLGADVENLILSGSGDIDGTGNDLRNVITGNGGDNVLAGRLGSDTLTGGGGRDTFLFDSALDARSIDRILDYSVSSDTIALNSVVFRGLSDGRLKAEAFKDITDGAKLDADDRILYDHDTGRLSYDADGSGAAKAVGFATIDKHPTLSFQEFLVV